MAALTAQKRKKPVIMPLSPARKRGAALLWWLLPVVMFGGWFYPYLGYLLLICMVGPLIVASMKGRYWCGWICPRGSFLDYIMARFSRNKPVPAWLKSNPFRIGMIIFLMGMLGTQSYLVWPNLEAIGFVFIKILTITTVVAIVGALLYRPRTWCTFCPVGTMSSWLSHGKKPLTVSNACKGCSACAKVCPMDIEPHKASHAHADCLKCERCIDRCPPKALSFAKNQHCAVEPHGAVVSASISKSSDNV